MKPHLLVNDSICFVLSSRGDQSNDEEFGPGETYRGHDAVECVAYDRETGENFARKAAEDRPGVRFYVVSIVSGFLGSVTLEEKTA